MSVYLIKGKGWRYDFTLNKQRYTEACFKTKTAAKQAEAQRRKEVEQAQYRPREPIPTDMDFSELVNRRLDHIKAYNSESHYRDHIYMAKRWIIHWQHLRCTDITREMLQRFVMARAAVSSHTANKELRFLRATFNFGKKREWIANNPADGIEFFPVDRPVRYIPKPEYIEKVIAQAKSDKWLRVRYPDTPDYLETLRDTLGRMSEINRLEWKDINFEQRLLILYTRKISGGLTPREVPMTKRMIEVFSHRYSERNPEKPWVFWNPRTNQPYKDRKRIMKRLCKKAEVPYFRFHSLRHSSASVMDNHNVPKGAIQRILGHKNRSTTDIYLHSLGESERKAIETFEAVRGKSLTQIHTQP